MNLATNIKSWEVKRTSCCVGIAISQSSLQSDSIHPRYDCHLELQVGNWQFQVKPSQEIVTTSQIYTLPVGYKRQILC